MDIFPPYGVSDGFNYIPDRGYVAFEFRFKAYSFSMAHQSYSMISYCSVYQNEISNFSPSITYRLLGNSYTSGYHKYLNVIFNYLGIASDYWNWNLFGSSIHRFKDLF
ncbi:107aa long hypothetical protein [Pyrococcus horikoshii OT3]|uniref:Uncharacterized protein n=1 Tax=Pyrococcus horikoshii (strain ATCC 700860 / DSM 12428 / JCM 9974 / NBRC 100139 / OT-3) TaxID=70601 RepID=O58472_PYRHO|nr:107aa long hypothetical protein [Pyrococcus horikoshii OT3]